MDIASMDPKKLTAVIVSAVIGVIMLVTIAAPIVSDAQITAGNPTTYNNYVMSSNSYRYDYVDSVELTATASTTSGISYDYVINGKPIELVNDYMISVISDGYVMQIGNSGQFSYHCITDPFINESSLSPNTYPTVTLTMENGEFSLMGGTTEIATGTYSWIVTYVDNGRYVAHNGSVVSAYCHKTPNDFIMYGSTYTSGELDTFYAYGQGRITTGVSAYTTTLNWDNTIVDGTTDVYKVTQCDLTVSDGENSETFTPYRCLYLYEVSGHESSGSLYSMLGIIPIVIAIGIVISIIGMVFVSRNDY